MSMSIKSNKILRQWAKLIGLQFIKMIIIYTWDEEYYIYASSKISRP